MNLLELQKRFSSEEECQTFFRGIRWPDGVACPRCGTKSPYYTAAFDRWECRRCRYQFTLTAQTVFHGTRTPLQKWFVAIWLVCLSKRGVSAKQLQRILEEMELEALTPSTITDKVQLRRELDKIRAQGFAFDDEEAFPGIRCIAAPIREPRGRVVAAISATVPAQRLPTERSPELIEAITETASRISGLIVDSVRED